MKITPSCSLGLVGLCVILATSANAKKAKSFVTEEDEAKKGENRRNQNLLPPKFVAEKYGKKVGDSMNLETALKIDKEAQELGERPLNFFKVGDGEEVKLLPEVMSVLDMEHVKRDFVPPPRGSDKTPNAEEIQLRDTRWWGRLYLDGWPQTIQYLRAHFGSPPPLGTRRVVVANPIDVCGPLVGPTESYYDEAIVVARRGTCTFSSKAFTAKASAPSIAALILVNNEDGNEHLTGPDAHDLDLSVSMVAQADGELLLSVLERDRNGGHDLTGSMIPIHCTPRTAVEEVARGLGDGFCGAATHLERTLANEPLEGGWLTMDGGFNGTTPEPKFEFMIATFGTKVDTARPVAVAPPLPESIADACEPFREHTIENKAVVVQRGNCNFYRKVKNLVDAGAGMVIVANSETRLQRFGVEPRWKGLDIGVPTIMVTDLGGKAILDAVATSTNDTVLKFTLSPSVRERTWNDNVAAASERFVGDVEKDAETLKAALTHEAIVGWPERKAALLQGHKVVHSEPLEEIELNINGL